MMSVLCLALAAFLMYDRLAGRLKQARPRAKLVYALLLALSVYHLLLLGHVMNFYSYYDVASAVFGGAAERLLAMLTPAEG